MNEKMNFLRVMLINKTFDKQAQCSGFSESDLSELVSEVRLMIASLSFQSFQMCLGRPIPHLLSRESKAGIIFHLIMRFRFNQGVLSTGDSPRLMTAKMINHKIEEVN